MSEDILKNVPEDVVAVIEANKDSSEVFSVLYELATK